MNIEKNIFLSTIKMSLFNVPMPPTIAGSLTVDSLNVNNITRLMGQVVGDAMSSLNTWKGAARAATTANIALSGLLTVDGVVLVSGDKVLVKNQATGSQNGLYIVQSTAWYRSDDMAVGYGVAGAAIFIVEGTVAAEKIYVCTNDDGSDVVGTDALVFVSLTATLAAAGATTNVQYNSLGLFAGDAGFTYNGAGNVACTGTLAAGTGITSTAGNITATAGNVVATAGNVVATAGSVSAGTTVTAGTGITSTAGNITATAGNVVATAGNVVATAGNVVATAGSVSAGTTVTATLGNITATNGNLVLGTVGNKLSIAAGANASVDTATFLSGAATFVVANTAVTTNSKIFLTPTSTLSAASFYWADTIVNGVSFTINTNVDPTVNVTFNYLIIN